MKKKTKRAIARGIGIFFKTIGIIILCLLAVICSSNISYFKGHDLSEYRGSVILREEADSVGSIPIVRYDILTPEGKYDEIAVSDDDDFYNEGDTIR